MERQTLCLKKSQSTKEKAGTLTGRDSSCASEKLPPRRTSSGDRSPGAAVTFRLILPWMTEALGVSQGDCGLQWARQLLTQGTLWSRCPPWSGGLGPCPPPAAAALGRAWPFPGPHWFLGPHSSWSPALSVGQGEEQQSSLQEGAWPGEYPAGVVRDWRCSAEDLVTGARAALL